MAVLIILGAQSILIVSRLLVYKCPCFGVLIHVAGLYCSCKTDAELQGLGALICLNNTLAQASFLHVLID